MAEGALITVDSDTGVPRVVPNEEHETVAHILREFAQFQIWRSNFANQWEETAEILLPTSKNTFYYQNFNWPGQKKTQQQIDGTAGLALHRFCAIADSLVTPRNQQWHALTASGPDADYVMQDRATRLWFQQATEILFAERYQANANFSAQNYNNWQSLGAFGNATMYCDAFDATYWNGEIGLRYKAIPLGETFYGENHQGKVDRMIRWFRLTAYQAVQKWGISRLPANLHAPLKGGSQWPYNFIHYVKPREDFDPRRLGPKGMPFVSYYVSIEGHCLMQDEGGFRKFPFATSRYDQTPGEVYGRGPAQIVLPALKTLNAEKATFLKQGHRAADPVLLTADDAVMDFTLRPGSLNKGAMTMDGKRLVDVLPTGNIQISEKMMAEERSLIDDTFLVSLFKVLSEHPDMTATQVIELVNEKAMLVAPTLGRQHQEYIGSLIPRELDLLMAMQMLPPMPPRLREAQGHYDIVDTSPLALAAKAAKASGFLRTVESVRELANITQDMSLLDPFDFDAAIPDIARIQNVPETWMAPPDAVAAKRKNRAAAQAQQAQIQSMPAQAALMKAQAVVAKNQPGVAPGQAFGGPGAA